MNEQKAGFWARLAAHVVDWLILGGVFLVFQQVATARFQFSLSLDYRELLAPFLLGVLLSTFFLLLFFVYFTYFHGALGRTPGKMLFGLRLVMAGGGPPTYLDAFVRALAYQASWGSLGLGFIWAAFEKDRQGWHDKIAETWVIKSG